MRRDIRRPFTPLQRLGTIAFLAASLSGPAAEPDPFYDGFAQPAMTYRPQAYWSWQNLQITLNGLEKQLDELKAAGFGGVSIFPGKYDGAHFRARYPFLPGFNYKEPVVRFLSPEYCELFNAFADAAGKRGMEVSTLPTIGYHLGGNFLAEEEKTQAIVVDSIKLRGPAVYEQDVARLLESPKLSEFVWRTQAPSSKSLQFVRLMPGYSEHFVPGVEVLDRIKDGKLRIDVPAGEHLLVRGIRIQGYLHQPGSEVGGAKEAPQVDYFNPKAAEKVLNYFSDRMAPAFGGKLSNGLTGVKQESYEMHGANWTGRFLEEFKRRRGYHLTPYLPFVLTTRAGKPQVDFSTMGKSFVDTVRRAAYDYQRVWADLFFEGSIEPFQKWCYEQGVMSSQQTSGDTQLRNNPLRLAMYTDITHPEFWAFAEDLKDRGSFVNRLSSSGAHLGGKRLVDVEFLTNDRGIFQMSMSYLKYGTDVMFQCGVNRPVVSIFVTQLEGAPYPGVMLFGDWNTRMPWWPYIGMWSDYVARLGWIQRQAQYQAQIAVLRPEADRLSADEAGGGTAIGRLSGHSLLSFSAQGCGADYVDDTVLQNAQMKEGRLHYGPMSYELLVVLGCKRMEPATARALQRFVEAGGKVAFVGRAPDQSCGLFKAKENDDVVKDVIADILRHKERAAITLAPPSLGYQRTMDWARDLIERFGVSRPVRLMSPDPKLVEFHQSYGEGKERRDVFFFSNLDKDQTKGTIARFATSGKMPWQWDPQTGQRSIYPHHPDRPSELEIQLEPLESLLLVFEPELGGKPEKQKALDRDLYQRILGPWRVTFTPVVGEEFIRPLDQLIDLGQSTDARLNTFSGTLVYETEFELRDKPTDYTVLNLGEVETTSEVWLNGQRLGARWWGKEHLFAIRGLLQPGRNSLKVKVSTTAYNHLRTYTEEQNAHVHAWLYHKRHHERLPGYNRRAVPTGLIGPAMILGEVSN